MYSSGSVSCNKNSALCWSLLLCWLPAGTLVHLLLWSFINLNINPATMQIIMPAH